MKDLHSKLTLMQAVGAKALAATAASAAIDLADHDSAEIMLGIGIGGITFTATNKVEFIVTHSDDNSTYTAVTTDDILGAGAITGGIVKALKAAHAAAASYRYGYIGGKRYVKVTPTFAGAHATATPIYCAVIAGDGRMNPQDDQA